MPQIGDISTFSQIDGVKLFVETTGQEVVLGTPATIALVPPGEDSTFKRITFTNVTPGNYRMNLTVGGTAAVIGLSVTFTSSTWGLSTASNGATIAEVEKTVQRYNGIRDYGVYKNSALIIPSTGDNNIATFGSVVKIGSNYHCFYSSGDYKIRYVSLGTDGKTVGGVRTTILTPSAGKGYYSAIVRIEGSTIKLWCVEFDYTTELCNIVYSTASTSDVLTWTAPIKVLDHADCPDWIIGQPGICSIQKIGSTYHMFGTVDLTAAVLNDSSVTNKNYSHRTAWVATSSTGTSNWTFHELLSQPDKEYYSDEFSHLISPTTFSYTVNGELRHYLLASTAGSGSDYQQLQLFESCNPLFPYNQTTWLGTVLITRPEGGTFPTSEIDIISVVSDDITVMPSTGSEFKMYFGGISKDDVSNSFWSIGLATQTNVLQAIRPPYRSFGESLRPNLLREMTQRKTSGEAQYKPVALETASSGTTIITLPSGTNPPNRESCSKDLTLYVGENITVVIPIVDVNGDAVDLTGKTIYFVCEARSGTKIQINSLTYSTNNVNLPTATLTSEEEDYEYAIREVSTDALLGSGLLKVTYKPKA